MDVQQIKEIFKRYLTHKSSPAENKAIDAWYDKLDDEMPPSPDSKVERQTKDEIWLSILPELNHHSVAVRRINYTWLKVAAILLLVSSAGLIFLKLNNNSEKRPALATKGYTAISTGIGQRKQINLSDGSVITLNSGSAIRISNNFKSARNVIIDDGEAYFEVRHDNSLPFIVKSGGITTQVLGTAFNIRAYRALHVLTVGVLSGKVGVMLNHKPTQFLVKNQQLVFNKSLEKISRSSLDKQTLAWQQGNMVLSDAGFAEMAVLMEKNYGLHISTNDQRVQSNRFTTTLNTTMPALKALEVIAAIHHLKIKQRRDTIEIFR